MKKTLGIGMILMVALGLTMVGLAADPVQNVTVNIPGTSMITLSTTDATITFDPIDKWADDTNTAYSNTFSVTTYHNGSKDPDVAISSTALTNGTSTLDLSKFVVYMTPQGKTEANGALNKSVTIADVGKGKKVASARYGLTINADQESGKYTGTVTYTLVNQ